MDSVSVFLLERSKLAQHAYEENHKVCWEEAEVLEVEPSSIYRKKFHMKTETESSLRNVVF
jgi:hypothetical protein